MNIIIPIFPENEEEQKLMWQEIDGDPLFYAHLKNLKMLWGKKLHVFTDQDQVFEYLLKLNIQCHRICIESSEELSEVFPRGTSDSLKSYLNISTEARNIDIVVTNYRNPIITEKIINEAYLNYKKSKASLLMSITKVHDNPVQLNTYLKIVETDVICLLEAEGSIENYLSKPDYDYLVAQLGPTNKKQNLVMSKPFYFDWRAHGIEKASKTSLYRADVRNGFTIKPLINSNLQNKSNFLLVYEDYEHARRIISKNDFKIEGKFSVIGVSFLCTLEQAPFIIGKYDSDHSIGIFLNELLIGRKMILRVWPFFNSQLITKSIHEKIFAIEKHELLNKVHVKNSSFIGPVLKLEKNTTLEGLIIALLEKNEFEADLVEPLELSEGLFDVIPNTTERINLKTGKKIMGRQEFPDIYEPDGSLIIYSDCQIEDLPELIKNGKASGFFLDSKTSLKIKSNFDLLRLTNLYSE